MADKTEQELYDELYQKGFEGDTSIEDEEEEELDSTEESDESETEEEQNEEESEEQPDDDSEEEETDEQNDDDAQDDTTSTDNSDSNDEQKFKITIGGQEVELTLEEMKMFAQKGGDYTRKTQDLARRRAEIELIDESGLTKEDLKMLADIKGGKKEAFAALAKQANIDLLDVEEDTNYKAHVPDVNYELLDVVESIKADRENGEDIDRWISALPQSTKASFAQKPEILKGLHVDTKNGLAKEIMPDVIKHLAINPNADFVQTYLSIGEQVAKRVEEAKVTTKETKAPASSEAKKKAGFKKSSKPNHMKDHADVWDDDELYKSMTKQLEQMR